MVRLKIGILLVLVCNSASSMTLAQDESQFPYQALILNENAMVRSGPGEVHYATSKLNQGDVVEVYRHDPGGWCAIRPPHGSFGLVPESTVELLDANLGAVKIDGIQAWVGTRLGSVERPLWQIKLRADERVEILGEISWPSPEGHSTIWYQISPPAGEFRWIQMSDLQLPADLSDLPDFPTVAGKTVSAEFNDSTNRIDSRNSQKHRVAQASLQTFDAPVVQPSATGLTINAGWRRATRPVRSNQRQAVPGLSDSFQIPAIEDSKSLSDTASGQMTASDSRPIARVADANVARESPQLDLEPPALDGTGVARRTNSFDDLSASPSLPSLDISTLGPSSKKISYLEMLLTREIVRSPGQWRLATLEDQALAIKESTRDPQEKLHTDRLLAKIQQCKRIQENYESAYKSDRSSLADRLASTNWHNGPVGTGVDTEFRHSTTYDAYGWLNELVSNRAESRSPTYVLEDDNGRIIYHVSPALGLNLHRYLKDKVGIIGQRGYHRRLQLNHVTAERVIVLEKIR